MNQVVSNAKEALQIGGNKMICETVSIKQYRNN